MSEPFVGEIRIFGGNFPPLNWAFCDGSLLSIAEHEVLYTLTGTTYGGDGVTTFALPDLRGRAPIHQGQGLGLSNRTIGERAGVEEVTLTANQMPIHTHPMLTSTSATSTSPAGAVLAQQTPAGYTDAVPDSQLAAQSLLPAGGNQPHDNMPPYVGVNYIIALFGIFPSQS